MYSHLKDERSFAVIQKLVIESDHANALLGAFTAINVHDDIATHYRYADGDTTLELFSYESSRPGVQRLPFPLLGAQEMTDFVVNWLTRLAKLSRDSEPDTDGSTNAGFRIEAGHSGSIAKITTCWIIYGK